MLHCRLRSLAVLAALLLCGFPNDPLSVAQDETPARDRKDEVPQSANGAQKLADAARAEAASEKKRADAAVRLAEQQRDRADWLEYAAQLGKVQPSTSTNRREAGTSAGGRRWPSSTSRAIRSGLGSTSHDRISGPVSSWSWVCYSWGLDWSSRGFRCCSSPGINRAEFSSSRRFTHDLVATRGLRDGESPRLDTSGTAGVQRDYYFSLKSAQHLLDQYPVGQTVRAFRDPAWHPLVVEERLDASLAGAAA